MTARRLARHAPRVRRAPLPGISQIRIQRVSPPQHNVSVATDTLEINGKITPHSCARAVEPAATVASASVFIGGRSDSRANELFVFFHRMRNQSKAMCREIDTSERSASGGRACAGARKPPSGGTFRLQAASDIIVEMVSIVG
jgi:hypothetical protein